MRDKALYVAIALLLAIFLLSLVGRLGNVEGALEKEGIGVASAPNWQRDPHNHGFNADQDSWMLNGHPIILYSGNLTGETIRLYGDTGNINATGRLTATVGTFGTIADSGLGGLLLGGNLTMTNGAILNTKGAVTVTDGLYLTNNLTGAAHASFGNVASPLPGDTVHIADVHTGLSNSGFGLYVSEVYEPIGDSSQDSYGAYIIGVGNSPNRMNEIYGVWTEAEQYSSGPVTQTIGISANANVMNNQGPVLSMIGGRFGGDVEDSHTATAYSVKADMLKLDTGSLETSYGLYVSDAIKGSGVVTAAYGLYLEPIDHATTNYSIYSAGGANYLGGNLTLGAKFSGTIPQASGTITVTHLGYITPTMLIQPLCADANVGTSNLAAGTSGQFLYLYNKCNVTITISDTGTNMFSTDWAGTQYDTLHLFSDGTNWYEVARSAN